MNDCKQITEDDLVLLYYGEHEDPTLAGRVANDAELSARFDALGRDLRMADAYQPPERGADYGAEVWQRISPKLNADRAADRSWLTDTWARWSRPRFSLAGVFGFALVAVLAFTLGRNAGGPAMPSPGEIPVAQAPGIDAQRLLTSSVADHLDQLDLVLTEFVNGPGTEPLRAGWATDLLVANRLYRQSAATRGDRRLAVFLADIEPLLIELAYGAQTASPTARQRMQDEVRDKLLFRVRVMNNRLKQPQITT